MKIIGRDEPASMTVICANHLTPPTRPILTIKEALKLLKGINLDSNQEGYIVKIAVVLTAGVKSKMFWQGIQLPFFFSWPVIKWLARLLGCRVFHTDELKTETIFRLMEVLELFQNKTVDTVIVSGGGKTNSAKLMKAWLIENGIPEDCISTDDRSVSTATNMAVSAELIKGLAKDGEPMEVLLVSSWYHTGRAKKLFRKILGNDDFITEVKAYPPLTWECLREEYLYNLLSEPIKRLVSLSGKLLSLFDRIEKASR